MPSQTRALLRYENSDGSQPNQAPLVQHPGWKGLVSRPGFVVTLWFVTGPDYRHAVYAGSFDPITLGHTAIVERAARLYDRLTLAVGFNPKKQSTGLFSVEERLELLRLSCSHLTNVQIESFSGLLIDYCARIGAGVIVRGLRVLTDFEYEFQLALANRDLESGVETTFLLTEHEYVYVSSSLVKEIAANSGRADRYVSEPVARALREKFGSPLDLQG